MSKVRDFSDILSTLNEDANANSGNLNLRRVAGIDQTNNTSDANKPVSTPQQAALDEKVSTSGGVLTGELILPGDPTAANHLVTKQYLEANATSSIKSSIIIPLSEEFLPTRKGDTTSITMPYPFELEEIQVNSDSKAIADIAILIKANTVYIEATDVIYNTLGIIPSEASQWRSVCWSPELNLFVAVADSGTNRVMTSPDGITWTARTAAEANAWRSVCWSPELNLFVAVADSGTNRVMTSPDGITWTARSAATSNWWVSVCWSPELGLFVAVSQSGTNRVMTSPDGITWTARSAEDNTWMSVCWSPELSLFVAVAYSGTNRVMTSPDGITWTARTAQNNQWISVCWSPELSLFVAVADSGTNRVMTSPDGITWTARSAATSNWQSVCWSPELSMFVAVASSGTNRVMTSPDGITWTARSAAEANYWTSVCWSAELNLFVAVAGLGTNRVMLIDIIPGSSAYTNKLLAHTYGKTNTTSQAHSVSEASWRSVCWSPELGIFVAVDYDVPPNQVVTSPDGITWTARTVPEPANWNAVCWSPELGLFVAVSSSGTNRAMTSPDGITWTPRSTPAATGWNSVCWSPELGLFVAVASAATGADRVMTSLSGITWTARTAADSSSWNSVCWSPELNLFVAVAAAGTNRVMTSTNGTTWTARTAAEANSWQSVCWSAELGIFVAVAISGTNRVMTSPDGINWTARTAAQNNQWRSVCWSPELGLFVAVADTGTDKVMTSPDGINWTARTAATSSPWRSVCWSPELGIFVTVAGLGTHRVMLIDANYKFTTVPITNPTILLANSTVTMSTLTEVSAAKGTKVTLVGTALDTTDIVPATGFTVSASPISDQPITLTIDAPQYFVGAYWIIDKSLGGGNWETVYQVNTYVPQLVIPKYTLSGETYRVTVVPFTATTKPITHDQVLQLRNDPAFNHTLVVAQGTLPPMIDGPFIMHHGTTAESWPVRNILSNGSLYHTIVTVNRTDFSIYAEINYNSILIYSNGSFTNRTLPVSIGDTIQYRIGGGFNYIAGTIELKRTDANGDVVDTFDFTAGGA